MKKELEDKLNAIPEEKRVVPDNQIVINSFQQLSACITKDDLRNLFTNLLTNACNIDYSENIHPSFPYIISQLSTIDAQNLVLFKNNAVYPVCDYFVMPDKTPAGNPLFSHVFLANPNISDLYDQSISITSLCRLGLLDIHNGMEFVDKSSYKGFDDNQIYLNLLEECKKHNPNVRIKPIYSIVSATFLGKCFIMSCL